MKNNINNYLGVFSDDIYIYLFSNTKSSNKDYFLLDTSFDGIKFDDNRKNCLIARDDGTIEKVSKIKDLKISITSKSDYVIFYKIPGLKSQIFTSTSKNISKFIGSTKVVGLSESAMMVSNYQHKGKFVAYYGEKGIGIAYSKDLIKWDIKKDLLLERRLDNFDSDNLKIGDINITTDGILITYFSKKENSSKWYLGTALFDIDEPEKLIFRCKESLWEEDDAYLDKDIAPIGSVIFRGKLIVYFITKEGKLFASSLRFFKQSPAFSKPFPSFLVKKFKDNPILSPIIDHFWESKATFNPAAIYEADKVHILYRAVGDTDSSVIGYASSSDGLNIDDRLDKPIYVPKESFECGNPEKVVFNIPYCSGGGGNGGCEDPRLTKIDDRVYMTYVAFSGKSYPGVALTSIKLDDFLNKKWNWEKPVLISAPGEMHKNWVLFPELINGKFAILHSISPNLCIDYFEDLNELGISQHIKSYWSKTPQRYFWDNHVRGPGPPPLKTKLGWLLLYHAMDYRDPDKYKVGAMILAEENPTRVIYRSRSPVMEPDKHYENNGYKAGVVYTCGAVIKEEDLFIYYGGADKYSCVAKTNLNHFLEEIEHSEVGDLTPIKHNPS